MEKGTSKATQAAQAEALTRPVLGGNGIDARRQAELDSQLQLKQKSDGDARARFNRGEITIDQFEALTGLH